eukprot:938509-Ditylum_brightwellii.AAC.1
MKHYMNYFTEAQKKELFTHSSCGIRDPESKCHIWNVTDLHVLQYDEASKELFQNEMESEPLFIPINKDD